MRAGVAGTSGRGRHGSGRRRRGRDRALAWARPSLDPRGPDASFDALVASVAALLAWACVVWLALGTLLVVLAQARGVPGRVAARVAAAVTPRSFRRAVEVALGATLVSGPLAAPALAAPATPPDPAITAFAPTANEAPAPLPSVDRPAPTAAPTPRPTPTAAAAARPDAPPAPQRRPVVRPSADAYAGGATVPRARAASTGEVVVRGGDTLWSILGGAATNAEIARAWPRWYAANRAVIGRDPNLLHPGERLRPPPDGG